MMTWSSWWFQMNWNFSWHVPIVIGTCMLGRIVNVIKESEMDRLSTPWAMVRASAFHDIFALKGSELGCTSAVEHEIHITDSEPFKE